MVPAVGLLDVLRPGIRPAELTAAAALLDPLAGPVALGSPWAPDNHLASVIVEDVLGFGVPQTLTRPQAMRIPAVARSRHIICGTIARIELGGYRGDTRLLGPAEPSWIAAADGAISPMHRMLWSCDDLLFYGWACWSVTDRETVDGVPNAGFPTRMTRLRPMVDWRFEPDTGRVLLAAAAGAWRPAAAREIVLIPGPHEGLLVDGEATLRHARDLQRAAHNAARFPTAYLGLSVKPGMQIPKARSDDPEEVTVETILRDWKTARLNPDGGGVAFLGGLEAQEIGAFAEHILESGRNAAAVDVARHASIPADLIDATVSESSLHYSTSRDNDRRFVDYGLGFYMACISARLSQNDVTPRGQRVAFDLEEWLAGSGAAPAGAPGLAPTAPTAPTTDQETPQ
jgi:hypothetical protein